MNKIRRRIIRKHTWLLITRPRKFAFTRSFGPTWGFSGKEVTEITKNANSFMEKVFDSISVKLTNWRNTSTPALSIPEFGKVIRKKRVELGVSLFAMATVTGVKTSHQSGLETGRLEITHVDVQRIYSYFYSKGVIIDNLQELADQANAEREAGKYPPIAPPAKELTSDHQDPA